MRSNNRLLIVGAKNLRRKFTAKLVFIRFWVVEKKITKSKASFLSFG